MDSDEPSGFGLSVARASRAAVDASEPRPARAVSRGRIDVDSLAEGVVSGDRTSLGRAISLVESRSAAHGPLGQELLTRLLPKTGGATRVGITGVPGVGKSTFIESLGMRLVESGERVAVLAIDPSSVRSGGSILGDKTRMARLAADERAFIRPSPSARTLGGVARRTRETILVCEAAGYSVVLVETVGVGQSETTVAGMTDVFVALMLAGAGHELQGIKRGLLELVDVLAVNKADGANEVPARRAVREYESSMRVIAGDREGGPPPVLACSAKTGAGVWEVWEAVRGLHEEMRGSGRLGAKRAGQALAWMDAMIRDRLLALVESTGEGRAARAEAEGAVRRGEMPASAASERVVASVLASLRGSAEADAGGRNGKVGGVEQGQEAGS